MVRNNVRVNVYLNLNVTEIELFESANIEALWTVTKKEKFLTVNFIVIYNVIFKWRLLQFRRNVRKSNRQRQCTLQLVCEDRMLFTFPPESPCIRHKLTLQNVVLQPCRNISRRISVLWDVRLWIVLGVVPDFSKASYLFIWPLRMKAIYFFRNVQKFS